MEGGGGELHDGEGESPEEAAEGEGGGGEADLGRVASVGNGRLVVEGLEVCAVGTGHGQHRRGNWAVVQKGVRILRRVEVGLGGMRKALYNGG